jgi:hypothetical protein
MIYKVIGEAWKTSGNPISEVTTPANIDRHVSEFDNYTDASDYYSLTFGQVCQDMADIGGEFVITLMAVTDDNSGEILKRHTASTTILL